MTYQHSLESQVLTLVLSQFVDEFVRSTRQGGVDAACRLRTRVCEYVSKELGLPGHIPIRTRIYANTKGLASIYCYNKILGSGDDFRMFVRGFNMGHPMCDFVDAGDGKECADSKLRGNVKNFITFAASAYNIRPALMSTLAWFEQDIADVKCRAVIFGGSADNGYARLLLPYVGDNVKRSRIILVEGQPFVKELSELKDSFSIARFSDVFSTTKLASRRVSFSTTPPSTPIPNEPTRATTTATFASAAASKTGRTSHSVATVTAGRDTVVLLNSKGQRLDDIIRPIPGLLNVLKSKKHCNLHHILGKCSDSNCSFLHGVRLDRKGIEARRWIARQAPCQLGLQCRNEKCFLGHECPDKSCTMVGKGCRFTKGMHNVDRT